MIYLDHAATTRVTDEVFEAMKPFLVEQYANPSAIYSFAAKSRQAIDVARQQTAALIGAAPKEIYFTSGGTEANNWALKAVASAKKAQGRHIITSTIEHHAILHTCQALEREGFEISYIGVDEQGVLKLEELKAAIRPDTILISVMTANNEIGTIQPIEEIGAIAHAHKILFHTDAVQAYGHIPIDIERCHIDLLSASGHKLHAPKGVGLLYIRTGVELDAYLHGGAQERGKRAGTTNTPGIVAFGEAARIAKLNLESNQNYVLTLREHMITRILQEIPMSRLNGDRTRRLPGNVNISFSKVEGATLLLMLDQKGICASSGSACAAMSAEPSHVLQAIGLSQQEARGSIRLTILEENTMQEIDSAVDELKACIGVISQMLSF